MAAKRKSLIIELSPGTPSLRRRTIISSTPIRPIIDPVNDDNSEREQLRKKIRIESPKSVRSLNETRTESLALVFDKLSSIIQMSNAKKINTNNVWKIRASDYLQRIVSGNCKDFQFLATALSTTVQIYDMKVADLHNIVMQFANNLLQKAAEKENDVKNDEPPKGNKPKRRIKITAEPEALIGEPELLNKPSALLYKAKKYSENFMSSRNHFQAFLDVDADNLDYILDSEDNYWDQISRNRESIDKIIKLIHIKDAPSPEELNEMVFCPEFESFSFLNWNFDSDNKNMEDFQANIPASASNYVFDINAEVQPINEDVSDNESIHDDVEISADVIKQAPVFNKSIEFLIDMRPSQSSDKNLEYSFRELPGAWAGPSYWKLKGNINRVLTKPTNDCLKNKSKRKRKPKELDFYDVSKIIKNAVNNKSNFIASIIRKNITAYWTREAVTLPQNHFIKLSKLWPLQMNKNLIARTKFNQSTNLTNNDCNNLNENECNDGNSNNENFVDNIECQNQFSLDEELLHNEHGPLDIIETPALVPKLTIAYAHKAKFVDMKKVQDKILNILKTLAKRKTNIEILFSDVFNNLINETNEPDLSLGIVFSGLLHLCNQFGYALKQHEDLKDITILNVSE